MMTQSGQRMAIAAGVLLLGSIVVFCGVSIVMLLKVGSAANTGLFLLADPYIWRITQFTVFQALLSTFLSLIGGIPVAIALHRRSKFRGRSLLVRLMLVPMRMPTLVIAFALIGIWGRHGLFNQGLVFLGVSEPVSIYGLTGILIAHVFFNLPLTAQILLHGLDQVPAEYWRVGASLGFGPVSTFRFIEWPVFRRLLPGLAGLIFILCATSFTLVLVLGGGPQATTLEVAIYQSLHFDFDPGRAVILSLLQISLTILLFVFLSFLPVKAEPGMTSGKQIIRFDGRSHFMLILDCFILFMATCFVGLPLLEILSSGLSADYSALLTSHLFWQALTTSSFIALFSGGLAIGMTALLLASRHAISGFAKPSVWRQALSTGLGIAPSMVLLLPPVVLATGWFLILPDPTDTRMAGPILVIVLNALMALPFTVRMIEGPYQDHVRRTDRLSASLNVYGFSRFRLVDWPVLRSVVLRAFSLAMALSLGDLGAVALFGSDGFVTLPWLLFSKLASYRSTDAAGLALIIAIACLGLASLGYGREKQETMP